jgi:hypothetical protein
MNHVCGHELGVLTARKVLQVLTTLPQRRSSGAFAKLFSSRERDGDRALQKLQRRAR